MLKSLSIRNIVLIDSLDVDFSDGLVILSGETGAGKSMLLDSLNLLLGERSDSSLVRQGTDKLSVTGVFEVTKENKIYEIAKQYDLDIDDDIIIKRVITADGKNKILFNDQIITLKLLKELAQNLVEIHGQHDSQGLLNPATHCEILDNYGKYNKEQQAVADTFETYKQALKNLEEKKSLLSKAKQDKENLKHWLDELQKASPQKGEEEKLRNRRSELMNAEKILDKLNTAYTCLNGRDSVVDNVSKAYNAISKANEIVNNQYADIEQNLENTLYTLNDVIEQIQTKSSDISLSQNEIDNIETRLFLLKDLAKKHQTEIELLPEKMQELKESLESLQNGEEDIKDLEQKVKHLREEYIKASETLSCCRKKIAKELDKNIMQELTPLKMEKAVFQTSIKEKAENLWTSNGWDSVNFEISTNPNTPLGPLNKIASGGELSRLMLALKVHLAGKNSQETLVFDEIDAGIGGATAEAVGERLSRLAKKEQVFVVTHSPQVASFGDENFKVSKHTKNNVTTTTLNKLTPKEKLEEIARMLAGEKITEEARAAAQVLLNKDPQPGLF